MPFKYLGLVSGADIQCRSGSCEAMIVPVVFTFITSSQRLPPPERDVICNHAERFKYLPNRDLNAPV